MIIICMNSKIQKSNQKALSEINSNNLMESGVYIAAKPKNDLIAHVNNKRKEQSSINSHSLSSSSGSSNRKESRKGDVEKKKSIPRSKSLKQHNKQMSMPFFIQPRHINQQTLDKLQNERNLFKVKSKSVSKVDGFIEHYHQIINSQKKNGYINRLIVNKITCKLGGEKKTNLVQKRANKSKVSELKDNMLVKAERQRKEQATKSNPYRLASFGRLLDKTLAPANQKVIQVNYLDINHAKMDPIAMYQIKNNIALEEYKINNEGEEVKIDNFSSNFIISRGDIFLKDQCLLRQDQIKIQNSYQSLGSDKESHQFRPCSAYQIVAGTGGNSKEPIYGAQKQLNNTETPCVSIANFDHCIEDRVITEHGSRSKANLGSHLPSMHARGENSIGNLDKQKQFNGKLRDIEFMALLWGERSPRRQMHVGLCSGIEVREKKSRKVQRLNSNLSFENILNEAEKKQKMRKTVLILKFRIITDIYIGGRGNTSWQFSNKFHYFQIQVKQNEEYAGKVEYYKQRIFNCCISFNLQQLIKFVTKLLEIVVIFKADNGSKVMIPSEYEPVDANRKFIINYNKRNRQNFNILNCKIATLEEKDEVKGDPEMITNSRQKRVQIDTSDNKFYSIEQAQNLDKGFQLFNPGVNCQMVQSKELKMLNSQQCSQASNQYEFLQLKKQIQEQKRRKEQAKVKNTSRLYWDPQNIANVDNYSIKAQDQGRTPQFKYRSFMALLNKFFLYSLACHLKVDEQGQESKVCIRVSMIHELLNQAANLPEPCPEQNTDALPKDYAFFRRVNTERELRRRCYQPQTHQNKQYTFQSTFPISQIKPLAQAHPPGMGRRLQKQLCMGFLISLGENLVKQKLFGIVNEQDSSQSGNLAVCPKSISAPTDAKIKIVQCQQSQNKIETIQFSFSKKIRRKQKKCCQVLEENETGRKVKQYSLEKTESEGQMRTAQVKERGGHRRLQRTEDNGKSSRPAHERKIKIEERKSNLEIRVLQKGYIIVNRNQNHLYGSILGKRIFIEAAGFKSNENEDKVDRGIQQIVDKARIVNNNEIWHRFYWVKLVPFQESDQQQCFAEQSNKRYKKQVLMVTCSAPKINQRASAVQVMLSRTNSIKSYSCALSIPHSQQTNIRSRLIELVEQKVRKLNKYPSLFSYEYRSQPPPFSVVFRKTTKLCAGMYTIFNIVYTPSMKCGFARVYANWTQKSFYFNLSVERFEPQGSAKGPPKYWNQIVEYYTKVLKNVYFKTPVDQISERMRLKNMKVYNMIMQKNSNPPTGVLAQNLSVLPDSRAKIRRNQAQAVNKKQSCKLLSQDQMVMHEDIMHHYIRNWRGIYFLIMFHRVNPKPEITRPIAPNKKQQGNAKHIVKPQQKEQSNRQFQIKIFIEGKFAKLYFQHQMDKKMNEYVTSLRQKSDERSQNSGLPEGIIMQLIKRSFLSPTKIYQQVLEDIKNCLNDRKVKTLQNLIVSLKNALKAQEQTQLNIFNLIVPRLPKKQNKQKAIIGLKKYLNGHWIYIESYHGISTITRQRGHQRQSFAVSQGFQSNVPVESYNNRLIRRIGKSFQFGGHAINTCI